jgi:hypothetical protein
MQGAQVRFINITHSALSASAVEEYVNRYYLDLSKLTPPPTLETLLLTASVQPLEKDSKQAVVAISMNGRPAFAMNIPLSSAHNAASEDSFKWPAFVTTQVSLFIFRSFF